MRSHQDYAESISTSIDEDFIPRTNYQVAKPFADILPPIQIGKANRALVFSVSLGAHG